MNPRARASSPRCKLYRSVHPEPESKIQTGTHGLPAGAAVNVVTVIRRVFQTEGIAGLYRGCALTTGRAAPSNAVLFCAYEMTMRLLRGQPVLGTSS